MDTLRSISKQSGESVESVLKKKRKATVGRICRKGKFEACNEGVIEYCMNGSSIATVYTILQLNPPGMGPIRTT